MTNTATLVREATIRWSAPKTPGIKVARPNAAADYLQAATPIDDPREHFVALALSTRHHVIGHQIIGIGTIDACLVHPRDVFRFAVLASASAIIVAHTHPSGDPTPSADDVTLTRRLVQAGELMGIGVVDHLIMAPGAGVHSLRESQPALFAR